MFELVLALQKGHGLIESEIRHIDVTQPDGESVQVLKPFLKRLYRHVKVETEKLYPIFESDPRCHILMKRMLDQT